MSLERRLWPITLIGEPARHFAIILLDLRLLNAIAGRGIQGVREKTCLRIIFHANEILSLFPKFFVAAVRPPILFPELISLFPDTRLTILLTSGHRRLHRQAAALLQPGYANLLLQLPLARMTSSAPLPTAGNRHTSTRQHGAGRHPLRDTANTSRRCLDPPAVHPTQTKSASARELTPVRSVKGSSGSDAPIVPFSKVLARRGALHAPTIAIYASELPVLGSQLARESWRTDRSERPHEPACGYSGSSLYAGCLAGGGAFDIAKGRRANLLLDPIRHRLLFLQGSLQKRFSRLVAYRSREDQ
jgi:hypothetical protein